MSVNLKFLDTFKLQGHLHTNFACDISQDNSIFIICDLGLYIVTQKSRLDSCFPEYMCHKYFLKPSCFAACEEVDMDINSFLYELPKEVLYETSASIDLSYNIRDMEMAPLTILCAQWSDGGMVDDTHCMLGLLTNLRSLEIYIKSVSESNLIEYKMILNLTRVIINNRKEKFVYSSKMPPLQKMKELRKRVEYVAPLTFQWSHTFMYNNQNCAVIFIGHANGEISVFRIFSVQSNESTSHCDFLCRYKMKLTNITALHWHKTTEFSGALCLGDLDGKISVVQVKNLNESNCSIENEVPFFLEKDRQVDKITVLTFDSYTILLAVKQCYLLIYGLDALGQVFDSTVISVNNHYITGITHVNNVIRVLTFTGVFKELKLAVHFKKIVLKEEIVPVKYDFSGLRTHGLIVSSNMILYTFIVNPYRLKNSIRGKKFVTFCLFHDANLNPLESLLENKSGSLRTFWDCLECLRLLCLKEQRFPWLGLNFNQDLDKLSLLELKTLRCLAKISEAVFTVIKKVLSYEIKPYIILHNLVDIKLIIQRLTHSFEKISEGFKLSQFELRSIDLQLFFLKELVVSGILAKAQVADTFVGEIKHILAIGNEMKFPDPATCCFCGENLIGSMCLPPHADSRCAFTLMPIFLAPSYKCELCDALALNRDQIGLKVVLCPYCDYPMERVCLSPNIQNALDFNDQTKSKCSSDCVKDSEEIVQKIYSSLGENELTIMNVSDDDDDESESKVRDLYFKLTNMKLEDDPDSSFSKIANLDSVE